MTSGILNLLNSRQSQSFSIRRLSIPTPTFPPTTLPPNSPFPSLLRTPLPKAMLLNNLVQMTGKCKLNGGDIVIAAIRLENTRSRVRVPTDGDAVAGAEAGMDWGGRVLKKWK